LRLRYKKYIRNFTLIVPFARKRCMTICSSKTIFSNTRFRKFTKSLATGCAKFSEQRTIGPEELVPTNGKKSSSFVLISLVKESSDIATFSLNSCDRFSQSRKNWTNLEVSLGGQLLASLITFTLTNSLPQSSANITRRAWCFFSSIGAVNSFSATT
jgi:hypothetical protein